MGGLRHPPRNSAQLLGGLASPPSNPNVMRWWSPPGSGLSLLQPKLSERLRQAGTWGFAPRSVLPDLNQYLKSWS